MTNLMTAHNQWCRRPGDECYWTLDEMMTAAKSRRERSREIGVDMSELEYHPDGEDGLVVTRGNSNAVFSRFAFEQMSRRVDFPPSALDKLSNKLVAEVLNERTRKIVDEADEDTNTHAKILMEAGGELPKIRAVTTNSYNRVWDDQPVSVAQQLEKLGWKLPPARPSQNATRTRIATEADTLRHLGAGGGLKVKVGDTIAPSGAYMGDRDSFIFLVNDSTGTDDGFGGSLFRILMLENSEVGTRKLSLTMALCQGVCGNLIIWGATDITTTAFKHTKNIQDRWALALLRNEIFVAPPKIDKELRVIEWMRNNQIADNTVDVVDNIYNLRISPVLTQKVIMAAIKNAEQFRNEDGDPYTWYGATNALTRLSQTLPNQNDRFDIDAAVGKMYNKVAKDNDILVTV